MFWAIEKRVYYCVKAARFFEGENMKAKTKSCRHKRIICASAGMVDFTPDQEPFESGIIECAGVSKITVGNIYIYYCPTCNKIRDIEVDPDTYIDTEDCTIYNRCNGH